MKKNKFLNNKKGTAPFVEALILAPIVIFIFVMIISNLFCYTKENAAEIIGREVVRSCIVCDSVTSDDSNANSMQKVVYDYFTSTNKPDSFRAYYIRSVSITDLDTEVKYTVDFKKNIQGSEFTKERVKSLDEQWKQGRMLSMTFYFSSLGLTKNFGELGNHSVSLVPSGVYLTISQIIENDKN